MARPNVNFKIIDEFNSNKTSIISEIVSNQDQKKFSQASFIIEKYLKVMPFNDELIGMKSQNETKKVEDEKLKELWNINKKVYEIRSGLINFPNQVNYRLREQCYNPRPQILK